MYSGYLDFVNPFIAMEGKVADYLVEIFVKKLNCREGDEGNSLDTWYCASNGKIVDGMPSIYMDLAQEFDQSVRGRFNFDSSEYFIYPSVMYVEDQTGLKY